MRFHLYFLLAAAGPLGLAACQSPTSQSTTASAPPGAAGAPDTTATATLANSPGSSYRVFRGQLPGQADSSTLQLVRAPEQFLTSTGPGYRGSYYGPDGHPYELQSQPTSAPDSVLLRDASPERNTGPGGNGPAWRLQQQPDGSLAGTVGGQAMRLRRVPPPAGSLTFAVRYFADSLAAFPRAAHSPRARLSWQALVPTGGPAGPRQTLASNMRRDLRGDTATALLPPPLPALYQQRRDTFFREYRTEVAVLPAPADTAEAGSYRASLNYEDQTASYVLFHEGDLLSVAYFTYSFTGGAHGNYGTTGASYDLRTGRRLRYNDIFLPSAAARLPTLLAGAVRPLVGLAPGEPLDKALLVKTIPITPNIFLTTGGAVFIYQPYEIAAYAQGEVRVFLPFGQLRGLLRQELPLPGPAGVAAR